MTEVADAPYPPLASLDDYPLHSENWDGEPYACQHPESPAPLAFDWRCRACVIAAQVFLEHVGDRIAVNWVPRRDGDPETVALSWLVARSLYWFDQ